MRGWKAFACLAAVAMMLSACTRPSRNYYAEAEVGHSTAVSFGTVLSARDIGIIGKNTGVGAAVGGAVGAGAGSYIGSGSGNVWAVGAGLVAGAVAGAIAEQAMADRHGVEYTVILESGVTLTIVQEAPAGERLLAPGERVMVQNSGGYQRVLPASGLPTAVKRPQGIKVID